MASFRDSSIQTVTAASIVVAIPATAVAGDLLVMFIHKPGSGVYGYHTDWQGIDIDEYAIGARLSSTCMWKIATAADISAGDWTVTSGSSARCIAIVVAYDISDWSGLVWNQSANGYAEDTSINTFPAPALADAFTDGITITSLSLRASDRTGAGSCDHGSLRAEGDAGDLDGLQVYDVVGDTAASALVSTVSGLGVGGETSHVIAVGFGPSAVAGDFPPCPDEPDGGRTGF